MTGVVCCTCFHETFTCVETWNRSHGAMPQQTQKSLFPRRTPDCVHHPQAGRKAKFRNSKSGAAGNPNGATGIEENGFWWKTVQTAMDFTEVVFVHTVREGLCISPQKAVPVARNLFGMLVTGRIGEGWTGKVACASFGSLRILFEIFHFNRYYAKWQGLIKAMDPTVKAKTEVSEGQAGNKHPNIHGYNLCIYWLCHKFPKIAAHMLPASKAETFRKGTASLWVSQQFWFCRPPKIHVAPQVCL